jgi:hypothetical protein
MSTPRATLYQLNTELECNGGTWLADFPRMGTRSKLLNGDGSLSVSVPSAHESAALVDTGLVVYVRLSDGTAEEWRISDYTRRAGPSGDEVQISALRDTYELSENASLLSLVSGVVRSTQYTVSNVAPTKFLTDHVLPALPSFWSLDVVEPTSSVTIDLADDTPKSAILKVISALSVKGVSCELKVTKRSGTSGYYISLLTQIGSSSPVVEMSLDKNVRGLSVSKKRSTYATRVYVKGSIDSATIDDSRWIVTGISGSDITLRNLNDSSESPVGFDNQFATTHYLEKADETLTQITASNSSSGYVTVASAASISLTDMVRIREGASGVGVISLEKPSATTPKVKKLTVNGKDGNNNLVPNPKMGLWSGSLPVDWSEYDTTGNATTSQETTITQFGYSTKIDVDAAATGVGRYGLTSKPIRTKGTLSGSLCYGAWVYSPLALNKTIGLFKAGVLITSVTSTAAAQWVFATGGPFPAATVDSWYLGVYVNGSPGTARVLYIGGGVLADASVAPTEVYNSTGPADMWVYGLKYLQDPDELSFKYEADVIDLARFNSSLWTYEDIDIGVTARIRQPSLGVDVTPRVTSITIDDEKPLNTKVVFSTIPFEFSTIYAESN